MNSLFAIKKILHWGFQNFHGCLYYVSCKANTIFKIQRFTVTFNKINLKHLIGKCIPTFQQNIHYSRAALLPNIGMWLVSLVTHAWQEVELFIIFSETIILDTLVTGHL